jgi:CheY-like chemotaxis protein
MNGSVLVVEDDEDIVENLKLLLEGEGLRVECAANGLAALEALAHADPLPSVILLDLMMPVMDGFEFREAQLADPRIAAVPVVLMTADGHLTEKSARMKADGGINKPFDIADLVGLVARFTS